MNKGFIKTIENKIGTLHDNELFVKWLEKKFTIKHHGEQGDLKKIKQEWQNDIMCMREDLRLLQPAIRQFAVDLRDTSTSDLYPTIISAAKKETSEVRK